MKTDLQSMSVDELVTRFTEIVLAQDQALLRSEVAKFNDLFDRMEEVKAELRDRAGDQRRALLCLYDHPNPQVRLKAIKATLAVVPDVAASIVPGATPEDAVAFFHTHPNRPDLGYMAGPSRADIAFAERLGIPGLLQSHNGMYYFGPSLRR